MGRVSLPLLFSSFRGSLCLCLFLFLRPLSRYIIFLLEDMQSFLAYKRFEKHARDQYDRDKKRAEQLDRANAEINNDDAKNEKPGHRPSSVDDNSSDTEVPSHSQSPDSREREGRATRTRGSQ